MQLFRPKQDLLNNSQLTQYPMAKNDDGPDALEMAVETAHMVRRAGALFTVDKTYV